MTKHLLLILLPVLLTMAAGCKKQTNSETSASSVSEEIHQPLSPKYEARYDRSVPPVRIDIEKAITSPAQVKLSQIASDIEYFQVGDDKYPITDVVATNNGFIALNQPKLYLYRKGMKRKRVGLKTEYGEWQGGKKLYYDMTISRLYTHLKKINSETGHPEYRILKLPPLEEILARKHYLYPDSISDCMTIPERLNSFILFTPDYYLTKVDDEWGMPIQYYTHTLKGDTICSFRLPIDPLDKREPGNYFGGPVRYATYLFDGQLTFRWAFNDTIYRIRDEHTLIPTFVMSFGKHRVSGNDLFGKADLSFKIWMDRIRENNRALFINIHKENKRGKEGWLSEKQEPGQPPEKRQIVYLKSSKQTFALPKQSLGFTNDLDDGLPFWPDGQTDGYLYMIRPAKELKAKIKLTGSAKQKELKAFLDSIDEKQNVMIVVK